MPPPAGLAELLIDLASALQTLGAPWYVFGAQAALIWGRPRLTTDVDATVRLESGNTAALVDTLTARGFALRFDATADFVQQTRVLPMRHEPSGLDLDLVLAGPGLEEAFLSRAVLVDLSGTQIPFISPEDLIVTKILAGRSKDLDDIRGVLEERGDSLRVDQIRDTLRMIESALGQSDLLPLFEHEHSRGRR